MFTVDVNIIGFSDYSKEQFLHIPFSQYRIRRDRLTLSLAVSKKSNFIRRFWLMSTNSLKLRTLGFPYYSISLFFNGLENLEFSPKI